MAQDVVGADPPNSQIESPACRENIFAEKAD
jgi:hypothetical protein